VPDPSVPAGDSPLFDLIGDVHGCRDELLELLGRLGYGASGDAVAHPDGRRAVLLGDLVDRGPDTPGVLRLAIAGLAAGTVLSVIGNHDDKLRRALLGHRVQVKNGLERSLEQLALETDPFRGQVLAFLERLPSHLLLDGGRLVAAHAGMPAALLDGRPEKIREFAMFGATTGQTDSDGLPERLNWAHDHPGTPIVVYGHTPVVEPIWQNGTIDIDTGCVFGGRLTALRYPELEIVTQRARSTYIAKNGPWRIGWPGGERATAADAAPAAEPVPAAV
jgi:diadenosine tetraphosphatase ApaH/serine/threonine PP2A family protein phosphatase